MLQDASVVCLSSIDWAFNRQIPQEVALGLSQTGARVLFVENTGVRRAALRDAPRIWARCQNWWRARGGTWSAAPGVDVLSPMLLPLPYASPAIQLNAAQLVRDIRTWLAGRTSPTVVVAFLPTPLIRMVISALRPALVVYYCLDRFAASSPGASAVTASERRLITEADLVLATSELLCEEARRFSSCIELAPSGVHAERYQQARQARAEPLPALVGLRGPIVGYVGSVRAANDLHLLARVAELTPDLQFVLAGPRFVDLSQLARLPNVRVLDAIQPDEIAQYLVRFDVGILPYKLDEFTAGIMPVKLKEYLAAGLPIVSTRLPAVVRFAESHPGLVRFGEDPASFVAALRTAVAERSPDLLARRLDVASQFDWRIQNGRTNRLIETALAQSDRAHARVTSAGL